MRNKFKNIILTAIAAMIIISGSLLAVSGTGYAGNAPDSIGPNEAALFELINMARKNPLGVAESFGMDCEQLLNELPELSDVLREGLPELTLNERLGKTARDHAADMLENSYYAYDSIDGRTVEKRMMNAGYVASDFGETLGLIFFNNFIDSERAVSQIFEKIFKNELDASFEGQRNILNPSIDNIGLSFQGGSFYFEYYDIHINAYIATCDFGASVEVHELELVQMINQARAYPKKVSENYGLSVSAEEMLETFPDLESLFDNGLPPLDLNASLYASAEHHVIDMFDNGYYAVTSGDGRTPAMRYKENGYEAEWAAESISRLSTSNAVLPPSQTVSSIFKHLILRAFQLNGYYNDHRLFSEKASDIGARVIAGESVAFGGLGGDNYHLTVCDFGARNTDDYTPAPMLIGVIYNDLNENDLFDSGEGASGIELSIKKHGDISGKTVVTSPAGGFSVSLESGKYRIAYKDNDEILFKWIDVGPDNIWQAFKIKM